MPARSLLHNDAFPFVWKFLPCETVGGNLFCLAPLSEDARMVDLLDRSDYGARRFWDQEGRRY
ncbi:hypothetical protein [Trichloromonas sp.]|uniref:hypothetical protein n=1 Tax=Trichloromonas sp. TaxID=3069249 RepID=UPI002A48B28F|nr:hypothetical protein [Trichloromonas sp.]